MNLAEIAGSSKFAGLETLGAVTASTTISGTINAGQGSILQSSLVLKFPTNQVISLIRFQAPNNGGVLPNYWYPVPSYLQLLDFTNGYFIYVTVGSHPQGRQVNISLVSDLVNAAITVSNVTFNVVAELYAYPF